MAKVGSNYVFNRTKEFACESSESATIKGVAGKTILLLAVTIITGIMSIMMTDVNELIALGTISIGYFLSPFITLVLSLIMSFKPNTAKILAVPYAIFEGLAIGSLGIIMIASLGMAEAGLILGLALLITVAIFMGGGILYTSGKITVTTRFRRIMFVLLIGTSISTATIAIIGIFNPAVYMLFFGNSSLALLISIIMVIVASIYTVISFDNANSIVSAGLDKNYEWYASFGIILNVIWLFYEVLRLLLIILSRSRD